MHCIVPLTAGNVAVHRWSGFHATFRYVCNEAADRPYLIAVGGAHAIDMPLASPCMVMHAPAAAAAGTSMMDLKPFIWVLPDIGYGECRIDREISWHTGWKKLLLSAALGLVRCQPCNPTNHMPASNGRSWEPGLPRGEHCSCWSTPSWDITSHVM